MMRISAAAPEVPTTKTGIQMCFSRSTNLAQLQGSPRYSGLTRPPTDWPKYLKATYIITSASRKFGTASPRKPKKVAT